MLLFLPNTLDDAAEVGECRTPKRSILQNVQAEDVPSQGSDGSPMPKWGQTRRCEAEAPATGDGEDVGTTTAASPLPAWGRQRPHPAHTSQTPEAPATKTPTGMPTRDA
jgi:hypothetical protein